MKPSIVFDNVSKEYHLGLTRTSIPSLISQSIRKTLSPQKDQSPQKKVLMALKDVSFGLNQGESLALLGSNGAGKTTILKLIASITKPTSGRVVSDGKISALIELGAGFHPDLTGRENIVLNGTILGMSRKEIDRHFDEIVAFSELEGFIDTPVKRYSSGMFIRLGFAIAACIRPEILLVDEVLAVGDASFRQKCLERIKVLINNGTTIIFVSHNLYLVQAVCKTAIYLEKGRVKSRGSVSEVINEYERHLHEESARKLDVLRKGKDISIGHDLLITKVEVSGGEKGSVDCLNSKEPAMVLIHYQAYREAKVNIAANIIRSDGLTCCMVRTSLDNFPVSVAPGEGIVSLTLEPLQLIGGSYYIETFFLNESDSMGLTSKSSDWFNVKGTGLSYEERSGVFEPKTKWNHFHSSL